MATPRLATPSDVVFAGVGCQGVSEGAALAQLGSEGKLWMQKRKTAHATVALGLADRPLSDLRGAARGRLSVVGIGPGQAAWRTPEVDNRPFPSQEVVLGQ